jgi:undecaprenyl pyrophosphate synthase
MILTGSSNFGHSICCKPDYTGGNCKTNDIVTCGPPSIEANPKSSKFVDVLNDGNRNYQMFAFCPALKPERCGMNSTDNGMTIYATLNEKMVKAPDLRYREGSPAVRRHDACFYLIKTDIDSILEEEETSNNRRLQIKTSLPPIDDDKVEGQDPTTYKPT